MKHPGRHLYWVLLLLAVSALAWCWWQAGKGPAKPPAPAVSAQVPLATPIPAPARSRQPVTNHPLPTLHSPLSTSKEPSLPAATNPPPPAPVQPPANRPVTNSLSSSLTNHPPPSLSPPAPTPAPPSGEYPRAVRDVLESQVALARQGLSPGSLDGLMGAQTRAALRAFQRRECLPCTGALDPATRERLLLSTPPLTAYTISSDDLARLQLLSSTWAGKSQQSALDYETLLELVAEKSQAHPNLLRRLNASLSWTAVEPGTTVQVPDVACVGSRARAAFLVISLAAKTLEAFDAETNLLVHFPCSIAQRVEKRPVGELHISVIAPNPNYTFDPEVFPESAEARQLKTKLILKPGPNNPVGVAWIGLDKPGYGIHGTPSPEQVGRTESHGCFRLANWNAARLVGLAWVGMPVHVQP